MSDVTEMVHWQTYGSDNPHNGKPSKTYIRVNDAYANTWHTGSGAEQISIATCLEYSVFNGTTRIMYIFFAIFTKHHLTASNYMKIINNNSCYCNKMEGHLSIEEDARNGSPTWVYRRTHSKQDHQIILNVSALC